MSTAVETLRLVLALAAVCLLAWAVLRWAARRGLGVGSKPGSSLEVLERVALDPKRTLYLLRAGKRVLVVGAADGAGLQMLAELDPDELPSVAKPAPPSVPPNVPEPRRSVDRVSSFRPKGEP